MDALASLADGFAVALTFQNLGLALIGIPLASFRSQGGCSSRPPRRAAGARDDQAFARFGGV